MTIKEVLEKLLRDSDETDDWGSPGRDDDAELLAPIVEAGLRAAASEALEYENRRLVYLDREGCIQSCIATGKKAMRKFVNGQ